MVPWNIFCNERMFDVFASKNEVALKTRAYLSRHLTWSDKQGIQRLVVTAVLRLLSMRLVPWGTKQEKHLYQEEATTHILEDTLYDIIVVPSVHMNIFSGRFFFQFSALIDAMVII